MEGVDRCTLFQRAMGGVHVHCCAEPNETQLHSYLCHGENAEQRWVTGVQPLQLHPHLKTVPALRK